MGASYYLFCLTIVAVTTGEPQCESLQDLVPVHVSKSEQVEDGLGWLTHPLSVTQFKSEFSEKWPFHSRRPAALHKDLGSFAAVDRLLLAQQRAQKEPLLMHPSQKFSQANCEWVKDGMKDLHERYEDVFEAYLDGATVVCHLVPAYWPPLAKLMQSLEKDTGYPVMANLYLSPRGAQGFTAHTDNKDGFIVQVDGRKEWVMHESPFPVPLREHRVGRPWEAAVTKGRLIFNRTVEAGDVLLVPRGFVHAAESTSDSASMHFTVSAAQNLEWAGLLQAFVAAFPRPVEAEARDFFEHALLDAINLEAMEPENVWLRRSLPYHYQAEASRTLVLEQFDEIVRQLRDVIRPQAKDVPEEMRKSFEACFRLLLDSPNKATVLGSALKANAVKLDYVRQLLAEGAKKAGREEEREELKSDTAFERCAETSLEIAEKEGRMQLHSWKSGGSANNTVSFRHTPVLELTLKDVLSVKSSPSSLRDLPGNDQFEKVCLVKTLVRKGVICFT